MNLSQKGKMIKMLNPINNCPFCDSDKLDISIKTSGRWERYYQVSVYCKKCHCYGPRVVSHVDNYSKVPEIDKNAAIDLWNKGREKQNEESTNR